MISIKQQSLRQYFSFNTKRALHSIKVKVYI